MKAADVILLELYLGTFSARQDAYVKDSRVTIKEPLTPEVANAAFGVGGFSISGFMSNRQQNGDEVDDLTHVGAIDFDMADGKAKALTVRSLLAEHGIPTILVDSRRGAHLWLQCHGDGTHGYELGQQIPAALVRKALSDALTLLDIDPIKAEVFPKKTRSTWGVGALRMPLMKHPKTGVRYPAYGPEDEPITKLLPLVNLAAGSVVPYSALCAFAGPQTGDVPLPRPSGPYGLPRTRSGVMPTISEVLYRTLGLVVSPGTSVRCPFHDDRHASLSVLRDDERAICHAPACELHVDGTGMGSIELGRHLERGYGHGITPDRKGNGDGLPGDVHR